MLVAYVTKYVTGSMISQEYSHHVRRARKPNCTAMNANPPHTKTLVFPSTPFSISLRWFSNGSSSVYIFSNSSSSCCSVVAYDGSTKRKQRFHSFVHLYLFQNSVHRYICTYVFQVGWKSTLKHINIIQMKV